KEESQKEFEESNSIKNDGKNSSEKKNNMKEIYEKMKKILEKLQKEIEQLEFSLKNINEKKIEYKKELLYYYVDQISDNKEKSEEEITIIDRFDKKINQLKEKTVDASYEELEKFNCESYVSKAKKSQQKINELIQEVDVLKEEATRATMENEVDSIQIKVSEKLIDAIKEKSIIDNASNEIQSIEKLLMLHNFSSIMDNVRRNFQKAKEEEEIIKEKFAESEKIKKEILVDFQKAEELRDSLIEKLDENSINTHIEEIRSINDIFATKIVSVNELLTIAEQYNGNCKLYHHSIERGKHKIEYLKIHDYNEEKKITDDVIEEINRYVKESGNYSNEADKFAIEARKNYELSCIYKEKMSDLLDESLLLGEKIKVEIKKNDVTDMLIEIKDGYYDIKNILEKLVRKLNKLKEKDVSIKEQDKEMAENKKSMDAFGLITVIKKNSDNFLAEIETLKQKASNILDNSESAFESTSTKNETNEEDISNKLKIMEDNLKNVLEALKKMESNKQILCTESSRIKEIENRVNSMESEIEIYEKSYEEGILEEIKRLADKEKASFELLIKSIKLKIDNTITILEELNLEHNNIAHKFEDTKIKLNEIFDIFDKSYKNIERFASHISESTTTYIDIKEKREKAKIEKENIEKQKEEMEKLINIINN
ncbi:reticulocyte binding protein, putative, partial [Plasmodium relictum]